MDKTGRPSQVSDHRILSYPTSAFYGFIVFVQPSTGYVGDNRGLSTHLLKLYAVFVPFDDEILGSGRG